MASRQTPPQGTQPSTDAHGATLATPSRARLIYAAIGLIFVVVYIASYPRTIRGRDDIFISPRENVGYVLTDRFAEGHGFSYPLVHVDDLPPEIALALTPRDAAYLDGEVVPKDFAGTMLFHGLLAKVWPVLVGLVTPLFAVLAAFVLAKLAEELFDRRVAMLTFILWLTYPPAWVNGSYVFTSDMLALFLTVSTFLFFVRFMRAPTRLDLVLMAASYGAAISVRYPSAFVALPLGIALLVARRLDLKGAGLAIAAVLPFVGVILLFNAAVYGDPLVTGFHLGAEIFEQTVNYAGESFFKIRTDAVLNHLSHYLVRIPNLLLPQLVGLVAMIVHVVRSDRDRVARSGLLGASLLIVGYYIPQDAWGSTDPAINASSLRYILPATALWTVYLGWLAVRIWELVAKAWYARWALGSLVALLVVANILTVTVGPQGLKQTRRYREQLNFRRRAVERAVEPGGLVMTRYTDKAIWPHRQTLTATFLVKNETAVIKPPGETWTPKPSPDRFAEIASITMQVGVPLYVADLNRRQIARYDRRLRAEGLRLERLRSGRGGTAGVILVYAVRPRTGGRAAGASSG